MDKDASKLIQMASNAVDLAPKPEQPPTSLSLNMILAMVHAGIISKRQGFEWVFKNTEPLEWDHRNK